MNDLDIPVFLLKVQKYKSYCTCLANGLYFYKPFFSFIVQCVKF